MIVLRPAAAWWAIVALTISTVLAPELLNSALEGVNDLLHPGIHSEIKVAKDMLAGAVLVASGAALMVVAAMGIADASRLPALFGRLVG